MKGPVNVQISVSLGKDVGEVAARVFAARLGQAFPPNVEHDVTIEGIPGTVSLMRWDDGRRVAGWLRDSVGIPPRAYVQLWGKPVEPRQVVDFVLAVFQIRESFALLPEFERTLYRPQGVECVGVCAKLILEAARDVDFRAALLLALEWGPSALAPASGWVANGDGRELARRAVGLLQGRW